MFGRRRVDYGQGMEARSLVRSSVGAVSAFATFVAASLSLFALKQYAAWEGVGSRAYDSWAQAREDWLRGAHWNQLFYTWLAVAFLTSVVAVKIGRGRLTRFAPIAIVLAVIAVWLWMTFRPLQVQCL